MKVRSTPREAPAGLILHSTQDSGVEAWKLFEDFTAEQRPFLQTYQDNQSAKGVIFYRTGTFKAQAVNHECNKLAAAQSRKLDITDSWMCAQADSLLIAAIKEEPEDGFIFDDEMLPDEDIQLDEQGVDLVCDHGIAISYQYLDFHCLHALDRMELSSGSGPSGWLQRQGIWVLKIALCVLVGVTVDRTVSAGDAAERGLQVFLQSQPSSTAADLGAQRGL
jgi:hypothetical protein